MKEKILMTGKVHIKNDDIKEVPVKLIIGGKETVVQNIKDGSSYLFEPSIDLKDEQLFTIRFGDNIIHGQFEDGVYAYNMPLKVSQLELPEQIVPPELYDFFENAFWHNLSPEHKQKLEIIENNSNDSTDELREKLTEYENEIRLDTFIIKQNTPEVKANIEISIFTVMIMTILLTVCIASGLILYHSRNKKNSK